jgi:tape measure domain-containing protein
MEGGDFSMTGETDTRIVNMRINNKEFLKGTSDSLRALDTLNKGIDSSGKGKGLQNMGRGVDTVKTKFGALQVAGVTALATIVHKAVDAGLRMVKALTIGPILEGFREYEKLLTSTQTIMANTGASAQTAGRYLDELNRYSDQTIYNFGQMADNIGKFTAAGVKLPAAVSAIKGLANSAALAGSNTHQLNTAMYQMSQALASGSIKLMDWNSLVNAGMGGKNMQNTLKATALTIDGVGQKMKSATAGGVSFRDSLRQGWLTADVFAKSMKVMAGQTLGANTKMKDFAKFGIGEANAKLLQAGGRAQFTSAEMKKLADSGFSKAQIESLELGKTVAYTTDQLVKMGYSKEAAKRLSELSQRAIDSATKIKTFSQLMEVVKESIVSGWAGIFKQIFGNLDESIKMWTAVGNVVTGAVDKIFKGAISMLSVWHNMETVINGKKMNGFQMFWASIGNIFKSIGNLLRPFVVLLGALIPNAENGGSALFSLTEAFYRFTVWLEKATSNTSKLNPVFEALGHVFAFVGKVLGWFISSTWDFLSLLVNLGGGVFGLLGTLSDLVMKFVEFTDLDSKIAAFGQGFMDLRTALIEPLIHIVEALDSAFKSLLSGDVEGFKQTLSSIPGLFVALYGPLVARGKEIATNIINGIKAGFSSGEIQAAISGFVNDMINFFKGLLGIASPSTVFMEFGRNIIEGLAAGLAAAGPMILDALGSLGSFLLSLVKGIFQGLEVLAKGVGQVFDYIGSKIGEMDKFDLANIFSAIFGGAVLVTVIQFVRTIRNAVAGLSSITGVFGEVTQTMQTMQTGIKAKALLNIAIAIGVLAVSLWILSKIPHDRLVTGMLAITFMMYQLIGVMKVMAANAATTKTAIASITAMAFAFVLMSTAILLLSAAVLAFGNMDTGTLIKGMAAVAVALGILAGAAYVLGAAAGTMIFAAAGVLILSIALAALAPVILLYSKISWETLFSGLLKMGAALVILAIALIPLVALGPSLIITAAALVVLSVGLTSLLGVITLWETVSWGTIIGGVAKIAAAIIILGLASLIAAPGLILLGAAAVLLGAGFLAIGLGLSLAGAGLVLIAAAGTAAIAVILAGLEAFFALLPIFAIQFVAFIRQLVTSLAEAAPEIVDGLVTIISEFLRGLSELAPKIAETAFTIIQAFLDALVENQEAISTAVFDFVQNILDKLNERMPEIVETGIDIVRKLIEGIGNGALELTTTIGETILKIMHAIRIAVETYMPQIVEEGRKIAGAIIMGIIEGLIPEDIRTALGELVDNVVEFFKGLLGINSPSTVFAKIGGDIVRGLSKGVRDKINDAVDAMRDLKDRVVKQVRELPGKARDALGNLKGYLKERFNSAFQAAKDAVRDKIKDIEQAIRELPGKIRAKISSIKEAAKDLGRSIIKGIGEGIKSFGGWVSNLAGDIKRAVNSGLGLPKRISFSVKKGPINISAGFTIPALARGTDNFGGGMALVGEAGPELVSMGKGSAVITNKNLNAFMKAVSRLARVMTQNRAKSENSPGGRINYGVGVNFKGKPREDGAAFAANIVAGLVNGLKSNQDTLNKTMQGVGMEMSNSFMDILGIQSPSTVFKQYATWVAQGFIDGLVASADAVTAAATAMGQAAILGISRTVTDAQLQLEALRAKQRGYTDAANELQKKAEKTKDAKAKAALEKEAGILEKKAQDMQEAVDKQTKLVERQNYEADRALEFENATLERRAEMRREDAIAAAIEASQAREDALALAKEAELVRKWDKARAAAIDAEAAAKLEEAKALSEKANQLSTEAYDLSQQVQAAIDAAMAAQIQSVTADDVSSAQAAFDAYTKMLADAEIAAAGDGTTQVTFEQNNYSPEAISAADAYRQGKSLVSIMERKLVPTP